MNNADLAFRVWRLMEATGWAWPPDVLLRQDQALMDDLLAISTANQRSKDLEDG